MKNGWWNPNQEKKLNVKIVLDVRSCVSRSVKN